MATSEEIKIPLRVVIDKEKEKVVFAEADSDFVDILFSFLTLPMGTIVRLLSKHFGEQAPEIGWFNNLYNSISNLDVKYFGTEECKYKLLNTTNSAEDECRKLKLNIDDTKPTRYFKCGNSSCGAKTYMSTYNAVKCACGKPMNREQNIKVSNVYNSDGDGDGGVFVTKAASFVISDDLQVIPYLTASTPELIRSSGIKDFNVLEEITFMIGFKDILNLLKFAFVSRTPLPDLVFGKTSIIADRVKTITSHFPSPLIEKEAITICCNVTVKAIVKSRNWALFAQAEEGFIDFLFSFIAFPLGRVVSLLRSHDISMPNIENLHRSVSNLSVGRYIKSKELKDKLLRPKVASQYLCANKLLFHGEPNSTRIRMNSKVGGGFLREHGMFMVTDDCVVTPVSSISSTVSYFKALKVPPHDVREKLISISLEMALKILKACLTSRLVLNYGLD